MAGKDKKKEIKNFQMKLNPKRRRIIREVKEKTRLGAKSKAITRSMQLYLAYRKFIRERFYEKFREIQEEVPLR